MKIGLINTIKEKIREAGTPPDTRGTTGILFWKERILTLILLFGSIIGFFIYVPSSLYFAYTKHWIVVGMATVIYFWILFLTLNNNASFKFKAVSLIVILFLFNCSLLYSIGFYGTVPIWLFLFPLATAGFLKVKYAFIALGLNGLLILVSGILSTQGYLDLNGFDLQSISRWINMGLNFMVLNTLLTVVLILLLKNLEKSRKNEEEATLALRAGHSILKESNVKLTQEISDRIQIEKALAESEKRYRRLVAQMNEGVLMLDREHCITFANEKLHQMTGYASHKLYGASFYSLFSDQEKDKSGNILDLSEKGFSRTIETSIIGKDGVKIPVLLSTSGVYQSETIWDLIVVVTDITDLKQSEKLLRENQDLLEEKIAQRTADLELSRKAAEQANQSKSEFLANVSHEFRTPLHHILNYSKFGITKFNTAPKEKLIHYFSQIRKTGERLALLVDDLLDLSSLEAGKTTFLMDLHDLSQITKEAISGFNSALIEKNQSLTFNQPSFEVITHCDNFKIIQVLQNLIANAMKFSPSGSEITIDLLKVQEQDKIWLEVVVSDNGVGIPPAELERVFEKFVQSTRTYSGAGGTGLGLSISKEIIEAHKGQIWLESVPDNGTSAHFRLPEIL